MNNWDSKEFYIFLNSASQKELESFYDSTTDRDRKLVCAGYCMGKYNVSIRVRQPELFEGDE